MTSRPKIPDNATRVTFKHNGTSYAYFIWPSGGNSGRDFWTWEALGNSGVERSQEAASEAARRWVRDGQ